MRPFSHESGALTTELSPFYECKVLRLLHKQKYKNIMTGVFYPNNLVPVKTRNKCPSFALNGSIVSYSIFSLPLLSAVSPPPPVFYLMILFTLSFLHAWTKVEKTKRSKGKKPLLGNIVCQYCPSVEPLIHCNRHSRLNLIPG